MVFYLWNLPGNKKEWLAFLIAGAGVIGFLIWAVQAGKVEIFENFFDAMFWIGFVIFWGMVAFAVLQWIFKKFFSS